MDALEKEYFDEVKENIESLQDDIQLIKDKLGIQETEDDSFDDSTDDQLNDSLDDEL